MSSPAHTSLCKGSPVPPALPQLALKPSRSMHLKTRDWSNQPWKSNSSLNGADNYRPPSSLLQGNHSFLSSLHYPVYNTSSSQPWSERTISSITSSPRTPSLLGVYDPKILSGQTTHLQHNTSSFVNPSSYSLAQTYPSTGLSSASVIPATSGLPTIAGLPTSHYVPRSTIPLDHNFHLPHSSLAHSSTPAVDLTTLNKEWDSSSSIPNAPEWNGFKWGQWRKSNTLNKSPLRLRTHNWGDRTENGWTGFDNGRVLVESFVFNRPTPSPVAPHMPVSSLFSQRKWKTGPYRQRNLRSHNWGLRSEDGWSGFNRGLYYNESNLPFNLNRTRYAEEAPISAPVPAPVAAPISAPLSSSFTVVPVVQQLPTFIPMVAPVAPMAPITPAAAPLTGRKGRKAAKLAAKQAVIRQVLGAGMAPPAGDPAINHYRRGAKATVPLVGPTIAGVAPPTGSIASRRIGRKNTLGRRSQRMQSPALPVVAPNPLMNGAPVLSAPLSAPLSTSSAPFIPQQHQQALYIAQQPIIPSVALPLSSQAMYAEKYAQQEQYTVNAQGLRQPIGSATF